MTSQAVAAEKKLTYVTLMADPTIHPKYEAAIKEVAREFGKHHPMFIEGRSVLAGEGEFEVRSPVDTNVMLGYFQKGAFLYARKAIEAANAAFSAWSETSWTDRVAIIRKAADLMEKKMFPLSAL